MLPLVVRLMWYLRSGEETYVRERGLTLRPKVIDQPKHKSRYEELVARLVGYIPQAPAAQKAGTPMGPRAQPAGK